MTIVAKIPLKQSVTNKIFHCGNQHSLKDLKRKDRQKSISIGTSNRRSSNQEPPYLSPSEKLITRELSSMNVGMENVSPQERIHAPCPHDVLCGRGGGINSHPGNQTFRNWVRERKEAYNLAVSKVEKAKVSRDILDRVANLSPAGRFLQREDFPGETGPVWVQIDDIKAMAKTSQALREGAPAIRAKAKCDAPQSKINSKDHQSRRHSIPYPNTDAKSNTKNVLSKVRPRSKSILRMIQANIDESSSPRRRKLNPEDDATRTFVTVNEYNNTKMTHEEQQEKMELIPNVPILLDRIPSIADGEIVVEKKKDNDNKCITDCVIMDPLKIVMNNPTDKSIKTAADDQSTTLTHCSYEQPTPTLVPVTALIEPPTLDFFPLPPTTFSTIPLSPTLYETQSKERDQFPPLISPTNDPKLNKSNPVGIPDLAADDYTYTENNLLRNTSYVDVPFSDPFTSDNERFDQAVEGHPDFSATGLAPTRWNTSALSTGCSSNRNLVKAQSSVSTRSYMSELSDLPDLEHKLIESFEWNKRMDDIYNARDLEYKSDVTYLIPQQANFPPPLALKRRTSNRTVTNQRQNQQVQ